MYFMVVSKGQSTEWEFFRGLIKFKIFFGMPDIPDIYFWVNSRCKTVVKVRPFSTECTKTFIANVYITSKKKVNSYRMSVSPSVFYIRIGTYPVLQHNFTGVRTVSPTAGLDRVL